MPRSVLWLCAPALLTGVGAAIIAVGQAGVAGVAGDTWSGPVRQAAAAVTVVFTLPALALTPIAGVLALVITRRRRWTGVVVWVLWGVLIFSMSVVVPACNLALANYVYSIPRPAEAPLPRR